jgi:hypothetical protein
MKYIAIFREPDGRVEAHSESAIIIHQENWKNWFERWGKAGKLNGGSGLTLTGRTIKNNGDNISNDIHKVGKEIVGGYILLNTDDLDEATEIIKSCPIFEFDGYAEIRELVAMQNDNSLKFKATKNIIAK